MSKVFIDVFVISPPDIISNDKNRKGKEAPPIKVYRTALPPRETIFCASALDFFSIALLDMAN